MFINKDNCYQIYTPTIWQTVILRNYGLVRLENIAKVLGCNSNTIVKEANKLGLSGIQYNPIWRDKSYLTIIRSNWHIIPTDQLLLLLDMSKEEFEFELKENDFLYVKLGPKPFCEEVKYFPLNDEQKENTKKIKRLITHYFISNYTQPFSFNYLPLPEINDNHNLRIVYPYSAPYGDILLTSSNLVTDNELQAMKKAGINGIWFQGLLSKLSYYPFDGKECKNYEIRRKNLNIFIENAKKYGIGVFLYFNEPRCIPEKNLSEKYSHLIGRKEDGNVALCISQKEVQNYLYDATKELLENVPNLAGIMTITSSENLTHCKHNLGSDCTKCSSYKPYQLAVLINNIIQQAIDDANSNSKLIANLWGWAPYCGYSNEDIKKGIKALNKKIIIMCVSEFGTHKNKKETYQIDEYSISHGEPCLETVSTLKLAKKYGHNTMAKIQVNTTWEMASLPYIPVFECVQEHIKKLSKLGVTDLFEAWTLGGYPSVSMNLANSINKCNYDNWLYSIYKNDKDNVKTAVHYFSQAFRLFPFNQNTLYFSPLQLGPVNQLFKQNSNYDATMVTFPYDDVSKWIKEEESEKALMSFENMLKKWKKGLNVLKTISSNPANNELVEIANAFYANLSSFINQYKYYTNKIDFNEYQKVELKSLLSLYKIASKNSTIGFEASNHYLYSQNMFLEKLISLKTK